MKTASIFGSVTVKEAADAVGKQLGVTVDKRKMSMADIEKFRHIYGRGEALQRNYRKALR